LATLQAKDAMNAFQWCKALLNVESPQSLAVVQRFEADSKFGDGDRKNKRSAVGSGTAPRAQWVGSSLFRGRNSPYPTASLSQRSRGSAPRGRGQGDCGARAGSVPGVLDQSDVGGTAGGSDCGRLARVMRVPSCCLGRRSGVAEGFGRAWVLVVDATWRRVW